MLKCFLNSPIFDGQIKELSLDIDALPCSFVEQVFDCTCNLPVPKCQAPASVLIDDLDAANLDLGDPDECLTAILHIIYGGWSNHWMVNLAKTTSVANFTNAFYSPSLASLQDHILVHNQLFVSDTSTTPALVHTLKPSTITIAKLHKYYNRVLPILQSSGFGKTRMCIQLSTVSPGMLICLHEAGVHTVQHKESFPLQDALVFLYLQVCQTILNSIGFPQMPKQHANFNKAHL